MKFFDRFSKGFPLAAVVLGAALLLVSFLYTKNRETLRQYL